MFPKENCQAVVGRACQEVVWGEGLRRFSSELEEGRVRVPLLARMSHLHSVAACQDLPKGLRYRPHLMRAGIGQEVHFQLARKTFRGEEFQNRPSEFRQTSQRLHFFSFWRREGIWDSPSGRGSDWDHEKAAGPSVCRIGWYR